MAHSQSELQVITHAKNLLNYVMTITQKSPKQFRFSLVGRMQEYVLNIVEELYYANDIFVSPSSSSGWAQRQAHQRKTESRKQKTEHPSAPIGFDMPEGAFHGEAGDVLPRAFLRG